jgi:HAD superfamily hydrolase (TIGR01490 family)
MKLSIYDLDKTLCKKDTFKLFCFYLFKKGFISFKLSFLIIKNYLLFCLKIKCLKEFKESVLFPLKGKNRSEMKNIIGEFLSGLNQNYFRSELLNTIELEKKEGYVLVLLTASPDIYAEKVAEKFGFNKIFATKTEFIDDKFTGKIRGNNLRGKEKLKILKRELTLNICDLKDSKGYGNKDDLPWLNLLGQVKIYK